MLCRTTLTLIPLLALNASVVRAQSSTQSTQPTPTTAPNIVYILADDMGPDSISALNDQIGKLQTPHLDRLIAQGKTFTDAHSGSSVCTPTRYGILTGRYSWRSRLKKSVLWEYARPLIAQDQLTLPEFLQQQGYHTAIVGKWHLGIHWQDHDGNIANANHPDHITNWKNKKMHARITALERSIDFTAPYLDGPTDHGFDHWFGMGAPNFPPFTWHRDNHVNPLPTVQKPKSMFGHDGLMAPDWKLEHILPALTEHSVDYITERAPEDQPYFLYLSLTSPHTPIAPSEAWQGQSATDYTDFLLETDALVGRIMDAIDSTREAANTLLIFTADNGTSPVCDFTRHQKLGIHLDNLRRGSKRSIYEGGHRVPFIARWPAHIPAGTESHATTQLGDLYATTADILGADLPPHAAPDSASILPALTGDQELTDNPPIVNHDYSGNFAIRDQHWKLIIHHTAKPAELYHLKDDPMERHNLASQHPERVQAMATTLSTLFKNGRSTTGPKLSNDGPIPFSQHTLNTFPQLKQSF